MRPFVVTVLSRETVCMAAGCLVAVSTVIAAVGPGLGRIACLHVTLVVVLDDGQANLLVGQAEPRDASTRWHPCHAPLYPSQTRTAWS